MSDKTKMTKTEAKEIRTLVDEAIFRPLKMTRSAQGLGR